MVVRPVPVPAARPQGGRRAISHAETEVTAVWLLWHTDCVMRHASMIIGGRAG
jgi:hypothetical protein